MNDTIAMTGHRPPKVGGYSNMARITLVDFAVLQLVERQPIRVITGMALGWDQAIAQACMELRIPFVAAVPFEGQEDRWPRESQQRYRKLLEAASDVHIVSPGGYSAMAMQQRNRWMIDRADLLLALWDGVPKGGTWNAVQYAQARKRLVVNVWDEWKSYLAGPCAAV